MKSEIIEKVKKLLALANSDNEAEAQLAAKKAQELLVKFNLTMDQIEASKVEYTKEEIDTGRQRRSKETFFIFRLLQDFYFVEILTKCVRKSGQARTDKIIIILGKPHNIEIAKYVSDFLHKAFVDLWKEYRARTGAPLQAKDSFYLGLYHGLKEQLKTNQAKVEKEVGLMVVADAGLVQFVKQAFPKVSHSSARMNQLDTNAREAGREQGQRLNISRGLNSASNKTGLFIGKKD